MKKYTFQKNANGDEIVMVLAKIDTPCQCDTIEKISCCSFSSGLGDCTAKFKDGSFYKPVYAPLIVNGKEVLHDPEQTLETFMLARETYFNLISEYEKNIQWMKENSNEGLKALGHNQRLIANAHLLFAIEMFEYSFER